MIERTGQKGWKGWGYVIGRGYVIGDGRGRVLLLIFIDF